MSQPRLLPGFGSADTSALSPAERNTAYHAFMHAPEWYLSGRSDDAAKAAAQHGYELELEALGPPSLDFEEAPERGTQAEFEGIVRETEPQATPPADIPEAASTQYQVYGSEGD